MLPTTMTAAVLYGPGDLRVETRPVPPVDLNDVAINVAFCGICGTDLHYWDGWTFDAWLPNYDQPWVMGHEFTGTVEAVGEAVDAFAVGDRVVVEPKTPCHTCALCRKGLLNFCTGTRGLTRGGAWAEYTVVDHRNVVPVPDGLDASLVALTEPLGCVLRGFDRIHVSAGDSIFVAGAGPIGLMAVQLAKHTGAARVLVSEPHASRRKLVETLGADAIFDPMTDDVPAAVRDLTRGLGADICIEAAGANPAFQACIDSARDSGTILVLSLANPTVTFDLRPYDLFSHELRIVGSNTRLNTFERALDLVPRLDLKPIVTEVLPLGQAEAAVRRAKAGEGGKIVLDCSFGSTAQSLPSTPITGSCH